VASTAVAASADVAADTVLRILKHEFWRLTVNAGGHAVERTYLITGGAGNLACQLTWELARDGGRVVLMDRAPRPVAAVAVGCDYVVGDVRRPPEIAAVLKRHRPAVIFHFASLLSGRSEEDREAAWAVNMDGAFALFEAAITNGVQTVVFPSSLAAYGGPLPSPLPEDHPQWPSGLYGVTKAAVERLGVYYHRQHGLDFRCLRLPVTVSEFAPSGAASAYASRLFVDAVRDGRFTFRVRPQTCPAIIFVKDVVRALTMILHAPSEDLSRRVYNIFAMAPSAQKLADAVVERVPHVRVNFDPDPDVVSLIESWPIDIDDCSARTDWKWQPRYDLPRMADEFVEELRRCGTPGE